MHPKHNLGHLISGLIGVIIYVSKVLLCCLGHVGVCKLSSESGNCFLRFFVTRVNDYEGINANKC